MKHAPPSTPHVLLVDDNSDGLLVRRALLLEDAYVYYVANDPNPQDMPSSYKLAAPGHEIGTLTSDTPNAVIGEVLVPPRVDVKRTEFGIGLTMNDSPAMA